jgi:hypothetical protein
VEFFGERMNTLQNVLKQKTSLVVHIRDVISRFVQAESINKKNQQEGIQNVKKLLKTKGGTDWSTTHKHFAIFGYYKDHRKKIYVTVTILVKVAKYF